MTFGQKLRELMEEKNITQKELSQMISISPSAISNYVQNIREPDFDTLRRIANFFQVSVDYLLSMESQNSNGFLEEDLLRVFRTMTETEKELFIEQGKVIVRINRKVQTKRNN